jgi:nitronate monooxygenase
MPRDVTAPGSEAGAHRGTFAGPFEAAMIGTMALVPLIASALGDGTPVIASGGIMDGRGIAAAFVLGAAAVQLGTAFLATDESGIPEVHKALLLTAAESETAVTRAFSGRPARAIRNAFMTEVEATGAIPPFPQQNTLTRTLRGAAAKQSDAGRLSLWAGQGARMARRMPAAQLVAQLEDEAEAALRRIPASPPVAASEAAR